MIWFTLIVLAVVLTGITQARPGTIVGLAACMVALVFLHFWVIGAIP